MNDDLCDTILPSGEEKVPSLSAPIGSLSLGLGDFAISVN